MFYSILIAPQVNRLEIVTYQQGIYELPHVLPSELRLRNLVNLEILKKCLKFTKLPNSAEAPCQNKNFVNTSKTFTKNSD